MADGRDVLAQFPHELRKAMEAEGLKDYQLATQIGVSPSSIQNWLSSNGNGGGIYPNLKHFVVLLDRLPSLKVWFTRVYLQEQQQAKRRQARRSRAIQSPLVQSLARTGS